MNKTFVWGSVAAIAALTIILGALVITNPSFLTTQIATAPVIGEPAPASPVCVEQKNQCESKAKAELDAEVARLVITARNNAFQRAVAEIKRKYNLNDDFMPNNMGYIGWADSIMLRLLGRIGPSLEKEMQALIDEYTRLALRSVEIHKTDVLIPAYNKKIETCTAAFEACKKNTPVAPPPAAAVVPKPVVPPPPAVVSAAPQVAAPLPKPPAVVPAALPQCSDGKDNDGNGAVDHKDAGCLVCFEDQRGTVTYSWLRTKEDEVVKTPSCKQLQDQGKFFPPDTPRT